MKTDVKGLKVMAQGRAKLDVVKERWDFCKTCPYLTKVTKRCQHCGCFMKAKVKFKKASCPIGIWGQEN